MWSRLSWQFYTMKRLYTFSMSHDNPWQPGTRDLMEDLYTLPGYALGHHYKAFQWLHLVSSIPAEVLQEVSVQISKSPLMRCVIFRRFHSFTHSFPTRSIHRVHSTRSTHWYAKLTSTIYYVRSYPCRLMVALFSWWSLHEPILRFRHDD
jgi:hypothetical protein